MLIRVRWQTLNVCVAGEKNNTFRKDNRELNQTSIAFMSHVQRD